MPKHSVNIRGNIYGYAQGDNLTINFNGGKMEVQCEGFIEGCTARAIHTVNGYHLCTRCAQAYAGYTPEIDPNLV